MMLPDVSEHTSSILDVDFSGLEEAACEYPVDCDKSAEWVWLPDCGCKFLVCDPHCKKEAALINRWLDRFGPYDSTCLFCGVKRWITDVPRAERI